MIRSGPDVRNTNLLFGRLPFLRLDLLHLVEESLVQGRLGVHPGVGVHPPRAAEPQKALGPRGVHFGLATVAPRSNFGWSCTLK